MICLKMHSFLKRYTTSHFDFFRRKKIVFLAKMNLAFNFHLPSPSMLRGHDCFASRLLEKLKESKPCADDSQRGQRHEIARRVGRPDIVKKAEKRTKCKCISSKCLKLYCECFKNGTLCSDACKCRNCENGKHVQFKFIETPGDQTGSSSAQDQAVAQA